MESNPLRHTRAWFELAVPNPTPKNFHTQLGCHLEEVEEMLTPLRTSGGVTEALLLDAREALRHLADHLKANSLVVWIEDGDRAEYLDALCDQVVTATGCAYMAGVDIIGGLREVNRSNFSKFSDTGQPIFDPNMKIIKSPDYSRPDLRRFV
jgi:predicted HAD superfamily Cof-like phosphohydrolase